MIRTSRLFDDTSNNVHVCAHVTCGRSSLSSSHLHVGSIISHTVSTISVANKYHLCLYTTGLYKLAHLLGPFVCTAT